MSGALLLGLVLQISSIALLVFVFRRSIFLRVGPYLIVGAAVYHGLTEIIQLLSNEPSLYRRYTQTTDIDTWTVVAGCAMLIFSIAYIIAATAGTPNRSAFALTKSNDIDVDHVVRILDWRILAITCLPLILVVGASDFRVGDLTDLKPIEVSPLVGLAQQFLTLALALTTISYVVSHRGCIVVPVLLQLAIMTLVGSRQDVFVAAAVTLFGLASLNRAPSARHILTIMAAVGVMAFAITGARSEVGRYQFAASDLVGRVQILSSGALSAIQGAPPKYLNQEQPLGERLDGNSFPAAILAAETNGREPVGLETARNDFLLAVPSFLNPDKLNTSLESRSEKVYLDTHFAIGIPGDFLATQFGSLLGWFGPVWLMFLVGAMGLMVGWVERLMRRRLTPSRLIFTLSLFACVMSYTKGMDVWALEFRGAALMVVLVFFADRIRGSRPGQIGVGKTIRALNVGNEAFETGPLDDRATGGSSTI